MEVDGALGWVGGGERVVSGTLFWSSGMYVLLDNAHFFCGSHSI